MLHPIKNIFSSIVAVLLIAAIFSCKNSSSKNHRTVEPAFYYWKSIFKLSAIEKQRLEQLKVQTLYVKFFDVDWNETAHTAIPVAQLRIQDAGFLQQKNIVPVVFITNECIFKTDSLQTDSIAIRISKLVKDMCAVNNINHLKELQIDCDWTSSTKEKYFAILRRIRSMDTTLLVSATIRLHQIKFSEKTGIPPVEKGLLMCYNMGNLKKPGTNNSIIETEELKKYIANLGKYPLPLDVGLPVFEWNVLIRNGSFAGLMPALPDDIFKSNIFTANGNRYRVNNDTLLNGYPLKKNDVIRNEPSDYKTIIECAEAVGRQLSNKPVRVSLYHLDSLTLSKYPLYEMENIFNSLR